MEQQKDQTTSVTVGICLELLCTFHMPRAPCLATAKWQGFVKLPRMSHHVTLLGCGVATGNARRKDRTGPISCGTVAANHSTDHNLCGLKKKKKKKKRANCAELSNSDMETNQFVPKLTNYLEYTSSHVLLGLE